MKKLQIIILIGTLCIGLIGCSKKIIFHLGETKTVYESKEESERVSEESGEMPEGKIEDDWQLTNGDRVEVNELFSQICENGTYLFVKAVDEVRVVIGYLLDGRVQLTMYNMAEQQIETQIETNLTSDLVLNRISISGNFLQVYDGNHYKVINLSTGQDEIDIENIGEFSDINNSFQFAYGLYTISSDGTIFLYTTFPGEEDAIQELHWIDRKTGEDSILQTYNRNLYQEKELLSITDLQLTSDGTRLFFYGTYWEEVKDGMPVGSTSFDCFYMDLQNSENEYYSMGNKRYQIYNGGVMSWEEGDIRTGEFGDGILTFQKDGITEEKTLQLSNPKEIWNPIVSANGKYLLSSTEEDGIYYYNVYRIDDGSIGMRFQTEQLSDNITVMEGMDQIYIWNVKDKKIEEISIK